MLMHKLKIASVMILSLGTFVVGAGVLYRVASADSERDVLNRVRKQSAPTASPPAAEKALGKTVSGSRPARQATRWSSPDFRIPSPESRTWFDINTDQSNPIPVLRSGSVMVVESADGTGWEAMEQAQAGDPQSTAGVWKKLTVPPGIKATPIVSESTVALVYQGKQIHEVAAFAGQFRGWSTQRLRKPVQ